MISLIFGKPAEQIHFDDNLPLLSLAGPLILYAGCSFHPTTRPRVDGPAHDLTVR
jgi:hypothetical protein